MTVTHQAAAVMPYRREVKLLGLIAVVAACGASSVHYVHREDLAQRLNDAGTVRDMFGDIVANGGLWFADPTCAKQFEQPSDDIPPEQLDAFARCIAGLHLQASSRTDELGDVIVLTYAPGIEVEARVVKDPQLGLQLTWIGFASRRTIDTAPTITSQALEALRVSGDRDGPLDADTAATLVLDPTPTSHAEYAWLRVCIDPDGAVTLADPFETTSPVAAAAFSAAAKRWTFKPFTAGGQAVAACAMKQLAYPPGQGPRVEILPLPPPMSRSQKSPIVLVGDSRAARQHEATRLAGTTKFVPSARVQDTLGHQSTSAAFLVCADATGAVESTLPLASTGFPNFDHELMRTMLEWKFAPYVVNDEASPVCRPVSFVFNERRKPS
jgi:hypothetical protein